MTLTKTIHIDDDALEVIGEMEWVEDGNAVIGKIVGGQLERKLYEAVNKGLDALGGKWNRSKKGHVFIIDPRPSIQDMLDTGTVILERDGYFPTPLEIGKRIAEYANIGVAADVLEPSAGTGELAEAILETQPHCNLWVGEKNADRRAILEARPFNVLPYTDFLKYDTRKWDIIIQNPPFEELQDIDHVLHAYSLLVPGGVLVSVMGNAPFFREDKKAKKFRDWLQSVRHEIYDLQVGSFKASGTMVGSKIIVIFKEE